MLEAVERDRGLLASVDEETRRRLLVAAGRVSRPTGAAERRLNRAFRKKEARDRRAADEAALERTGMRAARREAVFATPAALVTCEPDGGRRQEAEGTRGTGTGTGTGPELLEPRRCYICKQDYRRVHHFYDGLCPACGDFNHRKRLQTADLRGRVALLTGGRVKIGYHAGILLLRAGARLIVTTRFPRDAALRYAREADFEAWRDRLEIYGLDLRHTPSVELLAQHLGARYDRLDFVLHNACQTVRRPPAFYAHMLETETAALAALPDAARPLVADYEALRAGRGERLARGLAAPAELSQARVAPEDGLLASGAVALFPEGRLDADLQQVDLRDMNSWRLTLAEVPTVELLEVHLVNAIAPFVLNARLKPLMLRQRTLDKHIVNVSAMEGQFNRGLKTDKHPHTNMAKAALNMMTRTAAQDYARDGIHMNSVDTGWITDEDPAAIAERKAREQGGTFRPPLDVVDGAARICDPIFDGLNTGVHRWGLFLKDYAPTEW